jgi:hypothetical protein
MSAITQAIYNSLVGNAGLVALLASYKGNPAVFTSDPRPGNSELPCIVTVGEVLQNPSDTKTCLGREVWRDIRCYAPPAGSDELIEDIAEAVRAIFHRQIVPISGYNIIISRVDGPLVANEDRAQGRLLTIKMIIKEN